MSRPDFKISTINDARDTATKLYSFRAALDEIQSPRWMAQVEEVRRAYQHGGKKAADAPKKSLPGLLFSGTFRTRNKEALIEHSGLICVDLDNLGDAVEGTRDLIVQDPHTLAAFISPTGTGLKVVFRCDPAKDHYLSFRAASEYVLRHFGLEIDEACKDVNRICFVSHDPDLFAADDAEVLPYPEPAKEFHVPLEQPRAGLPETTPGDDYDSRGDLPGLLRSHGWTAVGKHGWRRPDKTDGISATLDKVPGRFYVFSSSTQFASNHVYKPWHVFAILNCHGDFRQAARELGAMGFGAQRSVGKPIENNGARGILVLEDDDAPLPAAEVPKQVIPNQPIQTNRRSLFNFNLIPDGHESILLGDRYLNRGDGAVLVSTSGMGKSSASIQMAAELALNLGPFGIQGNGPLRSLIMQSEDSDGDIAEVAYSLKHVLKLSADQINTVNERVHIVTDRTNRGIRFIAHLKKHIAEFKPDLVFINPLQAFMDGDVTESKDIGAFLREGLNGLNEPATFGYIIVHHTTKPAKPQAGAKAANWNEVMYDMAGGAEIINWARAIISLRASVEEGDFNLVLAKRGRRAGVTRKVPQGTGWILEPVTTIPLRHAKGRIEIAGIKRGLPLIYWEPRDPDVKEAKPEKQTGAPVKYRFNDYRNLFPAKNTAGLPLSELHRRLLPNGEIKKNILHAVCERWSDDVEIIDIPNQPRRYRARL